MGMEIAVLVILTIFVAICFFWGWNDYSEMLYAPANSMEINVTGRQWQWQFEYPDGHQMVNEVVVPLGKPVKLIMTSADVLHAFYVPDFRVMEGVIPNRYTSVWFTATELGDHDIFCTQYCGTAHSKMLAKVHVVDPKEYDRWTMGWEFHQRTGTESTLPTGTQGASDSALTLAQKGQKLFNEKGCTACHSITGVVIVGPSLKGVYNHEVELDGGKEVKADENYIRESIMDPQAKIVKGFPPVMPTFKGTLSDEDINDLVAFVKSLGQ
jgi:cytochrome c oxidase subunit 2